MATSELQEQLSTRGDLFLEILADWIGKGIPFNPELAYLIARHLGITTKEQWLVTMVMASNLIDESPLLEEIHHPDYDRLHQSWGADWDYGKVRHPSLDAMQ